MKISIKEFKANFEKIINREGIKEEIVITYRGKKMAKLIPFRNETDKKPIEDAIFGLWADKTEISVEDQVRAIRKARTF